MADELNNAGQPAPDVGGDAPSVLSPSLSPSPVPSSSAPDFSPGLTLDRPGWDEAGTASGGGNDSGAGAAGADSLPGGTASGGVPSAPAAPTPWSIHEAAKQHGIDLSRYADPNEAFAAIVSHARVADQHRQMAEYGQRYLQNAREFEEFIARRQQEQQQQRQQQQPAEANAKPAWEAPPWDPNWLQEVTRDDQGRLIPLPGASPTVVQDIRRRQKWENDQLQSLLNDPASWLGRHVQPPSLEQQRAEIEQAVLAKVQQAFGQVNQHQVANMLLEQNADILFIRNEQGQVIRDPNSGSPLRSADGQALADYLQALTNQGLPTHLQPEIAQQWIRNRRAQLGQQSPNVGGQGPATAPAATPQAPALSPHSNGHAPDAEFVRRAAGYTPDAGGTVAPAPPRPGTSPSQNPNAPLEEKLRHAFASNGIGDGTFKDY